jgi:hypothetical protein
MGNRRRIVSLARKENGGRVLRKPLHDLRLILLSMTGSTRLVRAHVLLLSADDKETTAMTLFKFEMRKTRLQFRRIEEDLQALEDLHKSSQVQTDLLDAQARLFADIHFLFVCLKIMDSLFYKMEKYFPEDPRLKELRNRYRSLLHDYGDFRDDLEHIEDRPGEGVTGLGSTFGTFFNFGDRQIDIGSEQKATVEKFYAEVASVYEGILKKRRGESGQQLLRLSGHVKIP